MEHANIDPTVKAVVICGANGKFSAGKRFHIHACVDIMFLSPIKDCEGLQLFIL